MLRDRLVCGVNDSTLQRRLLSEKDLRFKNVYDICLAHETASRGLTVLKESNTMLGEGRGETLRHVRADKTDKGKPNYTARAYDTRSSSSCQWKCFRCEGQHSADGCSFADTTCRFCNKKGHIEKACFAKKRQMNRRQVHNQSTENDTWCHSSSDTGDYDLSLSNLKISRVSEKYMVTVRINKQPIKMEVDSGAATAVISEKTFRDNFKDNMPEIKESAAVLKDYQNGVIPTFDRSYREGDVIAVDVAPMAGIDGDAPANVPRYAVHLWSDLDDGFLPMVRQTVGNRVAAAGDRFRKAVVQAFGHVFEFATETKERGRRDLTI
ncbi:unnamed protein product [Phaedon cochleariae]|uniref:Peptidase A2 domain-containing protein n=1 Tax=Phaedon cochleariae TaxID=80249 RepID=A0A9N9SJP6_PHACE|nr:unnamed protein product [Phaedon cochleariae]